MLLKRGSAFMGVGLTKKILKFLYINNSLNEECKMASLMRNKITRHFDSVLCYVFGARGQFLFLFLFSVV